MTPTSPRLGFPPPLAAALADRTDAVVVTGGGGWIGQALLEMLDDAMPGAAFTRRVTVYGSADRRQTLRSGRVLDVRALERIEAAEGRPALYFHCAFLTKDKLTDTAPEAFVAANALIGDRVASAMRRSGLVGLFVPSSGAVYRRGTRDLDDDITTNAYGVMKRRDEERFGALAADLGVPASMPRVFNLAGPFINKLDLYALASMIGQAIAGNAIAIRARHRVIRSYVHVADVLALALAMLIAPQTRDRPVFDTRGEVAVELAALAERVRTAAGRPGLPIERPALDLSVPADNYLGDGAVLAALCDAHALPLRDLETQIADTLAYLSDVRTRAAA